tara:strand:- start:1027 stop:2154 length:1128 start_codon:yes stop_codon:yes gene_type:complete
MHQVENLQSYFRLTPKKPLLEEAYFPTPYSRYVLIYNDSLVQAHDYTYIVDVAEYIWSADPQIKIVQVINTESTQRIPNAYYAQDLSHNHLYFLVKNADVVVSSDPLCGELCGVYDKHLVRLSGNSSPQTASPFFKEDDLHTIFCTEEQPSFSSAEEIKSINQILPETIARTVLNKLSIQDPTPLYKTLYSGPLYRQYMVDYIPDFKLEANVSGNQPITARADLGGNFQHTLDICTHTNLHTLCIHKEVDIKTLTSFKNKIKSLVVEVSLDIGAEFIKEINKLGFQVILFTKDVENINNIRIKFIDWAVRLVPSKERPNLPPTKQLFYKSSKLTLSKGKKFPSLAARNHNSANNKVIDNELFWDESDHFLIYSLD